MEYRLLGRTGVRVSVYSLGTMMFGEDGNPDEGECLRIIDAALDAGINLIDTADTYSHGQAEEIVGKGLKGRRDEIVLTTKFRLPAGRRPNEQGGSRLWIMREVEASLSRLRTDHIDLYQMHRPDLDTDLEETLGALTDLVRQGKIRYLGSSTFPAWLTVEAQWISRHHGLGRFVSEQSPYSIFVRRVERDVLPVVQRYGMGFLAWSPLNGGWLTGKYRRGQRAPADSRALRVQGAWGEHYPILRTRFDLSCPGNQRKLDLVEELLAISGGAGLSLLRLALAFPLLHPAVTSVILGPRTLAQFKELAAAPTIRLSEDVLDAIDKIVAPGELVEEADRGWILPWMSREARRAVRAA
jgi:aryl-alcohol dehydrogenase-like predicted oxidoreductase